MAGQTKGIKIEVDEDQESVQKMARKVFVSVDTSDEELLRYDQEGAFLIFEIDQERFKKLSESTYRELSKASRTAYNVSEAIFENKGTIPQSSDPLLDIGQGGALDKQYGEVELANKDNVYRFTRNDLLYKRKNRGWKVAGTNDVKFASAFLEGGHFETKDSRTGKTDQVLMVMPRERYERMIKESVASRNRLTEGLMDSAAESTQEKVGYRTEGINEKREG